MLDTALGFSAREDSVAQWQACETAAFGAHWQRSADQTAHGALARIEFAVYSESAERMDLCVYFEDASAAVQERCLPLFGPHHGKFHGCLQLDCAPAGLRDEVDTFPKIRYAYRAHGSYAPAQGQLFNAQQLLLDPYAYGTAGQPNYAQIYPDTLSDPTALSPHAKQIAPKPIAHGLLSQVMRPRSAIACGKLHRDQDIVLLEAHPKGLTMLNPAIPEGLRGTIAALRSPDLIAHLQTTGINALSLLPVQYALSERHLHALGLRNYWGYNTLAFFCLDPHLFLSADPEQHIDEFRETALALRAAGIELIVDIVFNHTAEAAADGPILSFKGLDNRSWMLLHPQNQNPYANYSGCGNTLNLAHPNIMQWTMDCLRYWLEILGVSGFRFDLATILGRDDAHYTPRSALLQALQQDPVVRRARLICEPWDCGPDGYQLGNFPAGFSEWNDQFRDTMRGFWLQRHTTPAQFARRFMASSDHFKNGLKNPSASVNFVAAHDGFSLADVVQFERKQNHANGEHNRDGRDDEIAQHLPNHAQRSRVQQALQASCYLAQGTPMLLAGSEFAHSQHGNNNAYCQDNSISWVSWQHGPMTILSAACAQLRARHAVLRSAHWHSDNPAALTQSRVLWRKPCGASLQPEDWDNSALQCFAAYFFLPNCIQPELVLIFNASGEATHVALDPSWQLEVQFDSSAVLLEDFALGAETPDTSGAASLSKGYALLSPAHSLLLLSRPEIAFQHATPDGLAESLLPLPSPVLPENPCLI